MITVNLAPIEGRILLDGNSTVISITSSNGTGHYFRAKIYIDGELFDEQGWSRIDGFTAEKDLKKMYQAYFKTNFESVFSSGVIERNDFLKNVSIVINEHNVSDDEVVQSFNLPPFFIMYNEYAVTFNDDYKSQFLGVEQGIMRITPNGKISLPFMIKSDNESVAIELRDDLNAVIDIQNIPSFTGRKVFEYKYDLAQGFLPPNALYLILKITIGETSLVKNIRLIRQPVFSVKELAFQNNFGFFLYAYIDGRLTVDSAVSVESYEEAEGSEKVFEISEKQNYTLNSGTLLVSEKNIISQIQKSKTIFIYSENAWLELLNANKKANLYTDRNNGYSENLAFSVRKNNSVSNDAMAGVASPKIVLNHVIVGSDAFGPVPKVYYTLSGYQGGEILFEIKELIAGVFIFRSDVWAHEPLSNPFSLPLRQIGTYKIQAYFDVGSDQPSNELIFTI